MSSSQTSPLLTVVAAQEQGKAEGIVSICSAHPHVLRAAARLAAQRGAPLLVESTCNQVNQDGGYTGMRPAQFAAFVKEIAGQIAIPTHPLILGGDHLGPYPWLDQPAAQAMEKARQLVVETVLAGYTKLHLDASVRCADDPPGPLSKEVIAGRAAELCMAAERAASRLPPGSPSPCYVVGTEVPLPGGAVGRESELQVTTPEDAEGTIRLNHQAFLGRNLGAAWERVIALVVQAGVEFGDSAVQAYDRLKAKPLSRLIERYDHLVYEVHSTDYQTPQALRQLVEDHFAILKVGPALTFAFREAVFALAAMEQEWLGGKPGVELSCLLQVLEEAMLDEPRHWKGYYHGDERDRQLARRYSLSDRIRYYWSAPQVQRACSLLFSNLEAHPIPPGLLRQFMPVQFAKAKEGRLGMRPLDWVEDAVQGVLIGYYQASGQ